MALRVLLADESTTIKKVMQLALQDFAVEVKAVHVGVDVLEVARQFKPDVIFADVLLQKRNGYEVTSDLKNDPELKSIPVVLMWSSFMDLDEKLATSSGADARLEKPFDVEHLRQVVLKAVPKTHSQRLAHFLNFPPGITEPMKAEAGQAKTAQPTAAPVSPAVPPPMPQAIATPPPVPPQAAPPTQPPPPPARTSPPPMPPPPPEPAPVPQRATPPPISQAIPMPPPVPPPAPESKPQMPPPLSSSGTTSPAIAMPQPNSWSMDSFDDIAKFAEEHGALSTETETMSAELAIDPFASADPLAGLSDDSADEYAEFKLTNLSEQPASLETMHEEPHAQASMSGTNDDVEPWSHQDLSRFKLDLEPVAVEGEEFALSVDLNDAGSEHTNFVLNQEQPKRGPQAAPPPSAPLRESSMAEAFSLDHELELSQEPIPEIELPNYDSMEESEFEVVHRMHQEDAAASATGAAMTGGQIPQLSTEQLERIVRAQSRDIIEALVRKVVPDLATQIIRKELERLLQETQP